MEAQKKVQGYGASWLQLSDQDSFLNDAVGHVHLVTAQTPQPIPGSRTRDLHSLEQRVWALEADLSPAPDLLCDFGASHLTSLSLSFVP